jgi:hypothetical protein
LKNPCAPRYGAVFSRLRCRTGTQNFRTQQQESPYFVTSAPVPEIKRTVPGINKRYDMLLIFSSLQRSIACLTVLNTF